MIISNQQRFIFIHVYKSGGTSVLRALSRYGRLQRVASKVRHNLGIPLELPFLKLFTFPPHPTAFDVRERVGTKMWDDYFTFAFVRNPWDLQVSLYHYMRQTKEQNQY